MSQRSSDQELTALLADPESDLAERKESWSGDAPEKARQAVCAFANDLPGHGRPGILFVGAKDDGTPTGLTISDDLLRTLADIKTDGNILPPPTLVVQKRSLHGADIAVVFVQPADAPPVRYRGRIWIRTGPRRGIVTAQDERILNERRRHRDVPFDIRPVSTSSLTDLDRLAFEEYLQNAFAPDILAANDRTFEQRLTACRMILAPDEPVPTHLGLLVLGKRPLEWLPGAYIQFLRIAGTGLADPIIDEDPIDGPVARVIQRCDDKLKAHNREAVDITGGDTERRRADYPLAALQQLTRNAIMHRTYEHTNTPVRISWFDDRIEILNPGGPFGFMTPENFGKPGFTDYRNPHLADSMKVLGLVQRFGVGIQLAQAALAKNGNPPAEFIVDTFSVRCVIRHSRPA